MGVSSGDARVMSAMPPVATQFLRPSEMTLSAADILWVLIGQILEARYWVC